MRKDRPSPGVDNRIYGDITNSTVVQAAVVEWHPAPARDWPKPHEIPNPPDAFIDRHAQRDSLTSFAANPSSDLAPIVILTGPPGVGKSATAMRWARDNGDRFPDGQVYISLTDANAALGGESEHETLGRVLTSLGIVPTELPPSPAGRLNLYRSMTRNRSLLLFLDDASDAAQAERLRPTSPDSAMIVATIAPMSELLVDGAREIGLVPLDAEDAAALLDKALGDERDQDRHGYAELLRVCDGLPLAIRLCAGLLRGRRSLTAQDLVNAIERGARDEADPRIPIPTIFEEAYRSLGVELGSIADALASHPTPGFGGEAAAALLGTSPNEARHLIERLADYQFLEVRANGRYGFHRLLWHYLRGREADGSERTLRDRRIVDYYVTVARRVEYTLIWRRLRVAPPVEVVPFGTRGEAFRVFALERTAIVAAQQLAAQRGFADAAWQIAESLWPVFDDIHEPESAAEVFQLGVDGARADGNQDAEARLLGQLAHAHMEAGHLDIAEPEFLDAVRLADASGHPLLRSSTREWLGKLRHEQSRFDDALALYAEARRLAEEAGSSKGVLIQDYLSGKSLLALGKPDSAEASLRRAAVAVDHRADAILACRILLALGDAFALRRKSTEAVTAWWEVVELAEHNARPSYEIEALHRLAALPDAAGVSPTLLARARHAATDRLLGIVPDSPQHG